MQDDSGELDPPHACAWRLASLVFEKDQRQATLAVGGVTHGLSVVLYQGLVSALRVSTFAVSVGNNGKIIAVVTHATDCTRRSGRICCFDHATVYVVTPLRAIPLTGVVCVPCTMNRRNEPRFEPRTQQ